MKNSLKPLIKISNFDSTKLVYRPLLDRYGRYWPLDHNDPAFEILKSASLNTNSNYKRIVKTISKELLELSRKSYPSNSSLFVEQKNFDSYSSDSLSIQDKNLIKADTIIVLEELIKIYKKKLGLNHQYTQDAIKKLNELKN